MTCPECGTPMPEGSADARFLETKGVCYACDFERWMERRITELKGEKHDGNESIGSIQSGRHDEPGERACQERLF